MGLTWVKPPRPPGLQGWHAMRNPRPPHPLKPPSTAPQAWHAATVDAVLAAFRTQATGLDAQEAARRLAETGPNRLPEAKPPSVLARLARQFNNLLIHVLLAAALGTLLLGHPTDAGVILAVVLLNAAIGFVQEGRAEQALAAIRGMLNPRASVLRGGARITVAAEDIVPGDLVLLEPGDRVPADLRLVQARALRMGEAVLTGESVPVDKHTAPVAAQAALGDRACMAFSGTLVAAGQGLGVAVGTGAASELGRISTLISGVESLQTPLVRQMDRMARQLTVVILGVSALAFLAAVFARGYAVADAFLLTVALAVGAIPEGIPAVMTITLAIGVQRMAARRAIVRRLPAVETLGAVSVICSDKTGTLTRNEMTVRRVVTAARAFTVEGTGYAPEGGFMAEGAAADPLADKVANALLHAALLCNDAGLRQHEGQWRIDGDPMEGALVTLAAKAGLDPEATRASQPRLDAIPFDATLRFMATLHADANGTRRILLKGAPERLLTMCGTEAWPEGPRPLDAQAWLTRAEDSARHGQRVLAFAMLQAGPGTDTLETATLAGAGLDGGATLLGLVGVIDPPREEAIAAVRACHQAGVRVLMITGDHAVTAREIARQLGLAREPRVLEGTALDRMDDRALLLAARETDVFARTTPDHKLRLVAALQQDGRIVAMTGDGVNDAPALKRADIGVAMGITGTEAAKEAAAIVLADDNFASIVAAVREGRTVYDNLVKVIGWTMPTNGGEAMIILAALALGLAMPLTPVQILWINMVTAVALGLTLAFEPTEKGTMQRPPRPPGQPMINAVLLWRIVLVSALFVAGAFSMFALARQQGHDIETARTVVVHTIVAMEIAYLFSVRFVHGTGFTWQGVLGTPAVLAGVAFTVLAQALLSYAPFMNALFGTRPVGPTMLAAILACAAALLVLLEIEKWARRSLAGAPKQQQGDTA